MSLRGRPRDGDRPRAVTDGGVSDAGETSHERVVLLNPDSGDGSHVDHVHDLAKLTGFTVYETQRAGHTVELTKEAIADGAKVIAACGGDGTVNEVVCGIDDADAFDQVTLGVLPGGTGNNFAQNIGIETIDEGFEVLAEGETRQIDLGVANGRPFVNSCVSGITAEAVSQTTSDSKQRFGVFAYVANTLRELPDFEGFDLVLADPDSDEILWEGSAVTVHIGNARRFDNELVVQADMEDGLLDVTVVESMPKPDLLETAATYRLFGEDRDAITRVKTDSVEIDVRREEPLNFSLDGEMISAGHLSVSNRPRTLSLLVGDGYEVDPGQEP